MKIKNAVNKKFTKGFTLLELLVVVLIIGILAAIALPQYKMAVTKAKVASILPIMRRWKDALMEYKLQHGNYDALDPSDAGADLGVNWPSDWKNISDDGLCQEQAYCYNDYWDCAFGTDNGYVWCMGPSFTIIMYQSDESDYEDLAGMMTCESYGTEGDKVCKALGGKLLENIQGAGANIVYKLN